MATESLDWIRELEPNLLQGKKIPLLSAPQGFSWDRLGERLGDLFGVPVRVEPGKSVSLSPEEVDAKTPKLFPLYASVGSLPGGAALALAQEDIHLLLAASATGEAKELPSIDDALQESFLLFLHAELCNALADVGFSAALAVHPVKEGSFSGPLLSQELILHVQERPILAEVWIDQTFSEAWQEHFTELSTSSPLPEELAAKLFFSVAHRVGSTTLPKEEVSALHLGDVLLLDQTTLETAEEGRALAFAHSIPLYYARIAAKTLTIEEYPLYHPQETPMLDDEPISEEEEVAAAPPSLEELPVQIHMEIGQLEMSLAKLRSLSAGDVLELDGSPLNHVQMMVRGRRIGSGEMVKLGDHLGVKITELG